MELFAISGLINGIASLSFGFLVIYKNWRDTINRVFFLLMIGMIVWSFGYWQWLSSAGHDSALFWTRILSVGSTLIPAFYLHWVLLLLGRPKIKRLLVFVYFLAGLFLMFSFSDLFVKDVAPRLSFPFWPQPGLLYHIYLAVVYVSLVTYSLYLLLGTYKTAAADKRGQIFYVVLGSVMGFGGGLTNFFLWYGIPIQPFGNFFVASFPVFFGYAMLKHRLFNSKVAATELLVFTIWIFLLIRAATAQTLTERVVDYGIFVLTVFVGVFLVKSVIKEIEQREKLQALTSELEKANAELKRVDAAKSEFVSIVSHQLRTPLTAVKGYISMMREGSYGVMAPTQRDTLEKVYQSSENLIHLVEDLLNLSRIEEGRITYNFKPVDLAQMTDEVVHDLKTLADLKKLKLVWIKPQALPAAWADPDKIRQVLINFIDNAIKYTEAGSVSVDLRLEGDHLVFRVSDTGVGMDAEEQAGLFKKFVRGEGGRTLYTGGTGLGLYVASIIAEAHHGQISGYSECKGKGSVFTIKIPTEELARGGDIS